MSSSVDGPVGFEPSGSEKGNVSGTSRSASVIRKNAPGNRSDPGWNHGYPVDGDKRKIKCKYCDKIISGGVYRLKHHLACTQKDVGVCMHVPENVKKEMFGIVYKMQEQLARKSLVYEEKENVDEYCAQAGEKRKEVESSSILFKRKSSQDTINLMSKKEAREEASQAIARFFYNNAIPLNVVKSVEFHNMCESVARYGMSFKPPSYHEMCVKYLKKEVELTKEAIEKHKAKWRNVGCTIMINQWMDKRRTIINFFVNSPKGTVFLKSINASNISKSAIKIFQMIDTIIEEVGEEHVVQVVTDNASNFKAVGEMLMEKRRRLYWTPCAAHCINLMLEDFEKKLNIHKETIAKGRKFLTYIHSKASLIVMLQRFTKGKNLIRPIVTRFATSYLTLGCLQDNKGALMKMFTSNEWKSSQFQETNDGKYIEDIALDNGFWKNVVYCLRAAYPLIKVLHLVDSDEKPAMGFIYEEMDRAKEKIQKAYNGLRKCYQPIWNIIDERWNKQLHRPLHAAAYFLNPQFQYDPNFNADAEVKRGLYECLQRMVPNDVISSKIDLQLEDFKHARKFLGSKLAKNAIHFKHPADWWDSYGFEHPELQDLAVRILSLTCSSSSGCEWDESIFERVHTKKKNHFKQKIMNDVVFVMTNSKLEKKRQAKMEPKNVVDDLSSDDEWIVENNEGTALEEMETETDDNANQIDEDIQSCINVGSTGLEDLTVPDDEIDIHDKGHAMDNEYDGDGLGDSLQDDVDDAIYNEDDLNDLL